MVKLVTSRVHRCYSSIGGVRSARNERLNDIMHLLAVTLVLASSILALPYSTRTSFADRQTMTAFGTGLLTLVQLCDMFAISTAHRMFYQSPRQTSKRKPFFESPSKIDALVSALCLAASLAAFFAVRFPGAANVAKDVAFGQKLAVLASSLFLLATFINSVIGVPGLAAKLPGSLLRAHHVTVSLFLAGSAANVAIAAIASSVLQSDALNGVMAAGCVGSYALIWVGSAVNCSRVSSLLSKARRGSEGGSDDLSNRRPTGFFSWFKASKSDNDAASDSSDDFDEEEGFSSDDGRDNRKWRR